MELTVADTTVPIMAVASGMWSISSFFAYVKYTLSDDCSFDYFRTIKLLKEMGHRHMHNRFMTPGLHQHDDNPSPVEHYIPMEVGNVNAPFVGPMDVARGGAHSNYHWDSHTRSNEYHPSNASLEAHYIPPPFSRPPIRSSITGNTYTHYHNVPNTHNIDDSGPQSSTYANGQGTFKRKTPVVSESGNMYGGSSSSSSHIVGGEDPMRNVRSRSHVPNYHNTSQHYYHQPTSHSGNYSNAPVNHLNADVTSRDWIAVPPYAVPSNIRTAPPDITVPRHVTSQLYGGGSNVEIDPFFIRSHVPPLQHPHVSRGHSIMGDVNSYDPRRVSPLYRNDPPSYSYYYNPPHGGSSSSNQPQFSMENLSSRYSRHSSAACRTRRPRLAIDIMDSHHEALMAEQLPFSSRNSLDEYRDMRLDIDTMTYEDLLALEERIGNVSTGLSEDNISKCLRERIYQNHEEDNCPICLEEYTKGEKVGRMEKCGHEYHSDCIKRWLMMKKVCPICKSEC